MVPMACCDSFPPLLKVMVTVMVRTRSRVFVTSSARPEGVTSGPERIRPDPALAGWIRDGRLRYREDMLDGIESAPGSIEKLYSGANSGKLIIRL